VDKSLLPKSESLKDMEKRLTPFWHEEIVPEILVNLNIYFD
jgi:bisphosphoglycerate-dependent phosphoglycerate mutase